ncbi:MAG: His/Gly/Thr/Pro-type tRNA ligase C-terminal domain-containing protein [Anaerolineales bacterium]
MEGELRELGIPDSQQAIVFKIIDRRDKLNDQEWQDYALELGLSEQQFAGVAALLGNDQLWEKSAELPPFFEAVQALGVEEYVSFAPRIIRGLDYYTGTVLAISSEVSRSIAGGGRYDNLMADVGGDPLPGVGFAMGDMVLTVILEELNLLPAERDAFPAEVMVTAFDEDSLLASYQLAAELRSAGLDVVGYPTADKLGKQFRHADRIGVRLAVVLGPDEIKAGTVAVKDLSSGDQVSIPRESASLAILEMLDKAPSA